MSNESFEQQHELTIDMTGEILFQDGDGTTVDTLVQQETGPRQVYEDLEPTHPLALATIGVVAAIGVLPYVIHSRHERRRNQNSSQPAVE